MCGFFITNDPSISETNYKIINKSLSFRGPDFQSVLIKHKGWTAYHSRLSIIGTSQKFSQPYKTPNGGLLVFNGEILNFLELAKKYKMIDAISDTQVLANLIDYNFLNLNELDGFYSFVHIDENGSLNYAIRDRFGVKPLFKYKFKNYIGFSSEAAVFHSLYNIGYNSHALEEYKVFRGPIFSGSYFNNVDSINPGTCEVKGKYFDSIDFITQNYENINDILPSLKDSLLKSINSRLVSDVPVGLLYSGGIDSNLIRFLTKNSLQSFTGGFEGDYDLEFVKKNFSQNMNLFKVEKDQFKERFVKMIKLRKEPLSLPNEVVLSFLAEKWKNQGGKVLLSGEGADEFFAGYDKIYKKFLKHPISIDDFLTYYSYLKPDEISDYIKDSLRSFFLKINHLSSFEQLRQFFIKKHLPLLFRRLDFSLMYSGIEGREPFASLDIYTLAMKINPNDLFENSLGKSPLRKIAGNYLGTEFAYKKKVGFPIDVKKIFEEEQSKNRFDNYQVWTKLNLKYL